ncbi:MAG: hypothetical protein K6E18_05670 [Lachnospiraceae bacterium]|nr:hypothetical protein [Lachnospiraceae bacterium]
MKKTLTYLAMAICMVVAACSVTTVDVFAANNTALMTKYLKAYKAGKYSKAKSYVKKMTPSNKDTSLKKMSKKQKAAYKKAVQKYDKKSSSGSYMNPYVWGYYLADLDRDRSPELLIKYGTCEADVRTFIYTYKSGKAKLVTTMYSSHTGYYAYPGKGVVLVWAHMGSCGVSVLSMKGTKLSRADYGGQNVERTGGEYVLPQNNLTSHFKYSGGRYTVDYSELE